MSNEDWIEAVNRAREGDDRLFNKVVSSRYKQHFCDSILAITKGLDAAEEIYILSITKFWERFILGGEELPDSNINGYIFQMARNAFFEKKRKQTTTKASMTVSLDATEVYKTYISYVNGNKSITDAVSSDSQRVVVLRAVFDALAKLDPLCSQIIEKNILENNLLKTVKEELALTGTYNSIVKKKKRCIKKLRNLFKAQIDINSITIKE